MENKPLGIRAALEGLKNLPNLSPLPKVLSYPDFNKPIIPDINPDILKGIKPVGEQLKEALEPVYAELTRVTSELTKANERTENAEERAKVAELKADRTNRRSYLLSFVAFIIPFSYAVWSDRQKQSEEKEVKKMQSTLRLLSKEVQSLKSDISRSKRPPLPVKAPLRSIEVLKGS